MVWVLPVILSCTTLTYFPHVNVCVKTTAPDDRQHGISPSLIACRFPRRDTPKMQFSNAARDDGPLFPVH